MVKLNFEVNLNNKYLKLNNIYYKNIYNGHFSYLTKKIQLLDL